MKRFSFENRHFLVEHDAGKISISQRRGARVLPFIRNASWGYKQRGGGTILSSDEGYQRSPVFKTYEGTIGKGRVVEVYCKNRHAAADMLMRIALYDDEPAFLAELVIVNNTREDVLVEEILSFTTSARAGSGLFFTKDPARARVLEAGLGGALDLNLRCVFGDEESDSNGNILVHDLDSKESFLCGVAERPSAMVGISANEEEGTGLVDEVSGRRSFGDWKVRKSIVPFKRVRPGGVYTSNRVYFDLDPAKSPHEMLEAYAARLAAWLGIVDCNWPRDRAVPHGWNSWGNPTKTDPKDDSGHNALVYVHEITEKRVLDNFDLAFKKLARYGLEYFQIDDGHQVAVGDWVPDREKFPNGLKPVFDLIHERGAKTGMWIRPFEVSTASELYKAHPDWALEFESSFPMKSKSTLPLDLSRADVRQWLHDTFTRIARYYGVEWVKTDFTYNAIGAKGHQNQDMTSIEAFQDGFKVIRDAIGPAIFLVGIGGPCMLHYGLVNAERLTLDMNAAWGKDGPLMPVEQGIKPNARVISRRYYLHNRVWFTHACAIQFRAPLAPNEILVQATVIALSGSVFKVAETWLNMKDEDFVVLSKMLPIYRPPGRGMRPVDLMTREYPEVWDLLVDDCGNGLGSYHVVGMFNFGENSDLAAPLPEAVRDVKVDFAAIGLDPGKEYLVFEFWTSAFKGTFKGSFGASIEPRHVALLVLRERSGVPQFLSSNRHFTQGWADVVSCEWDGAASQLVMSAKGIPDHEHSFDFHVPPPYKLVKALANGDLAAASMVSPEHLNVKFKGNDAPLLRISLAFTR
ncbi:MAG: alpha-galactosidase [Candidatus Lokiarchaeota archaeon]|nr:alpha-galactosidase [Candidatus Lokiarchaeota archaeon]